MCTKKLKALLKFIILGYTSLTFAVSQDTRVLDPQTKYFLDVIAKQDLTKPPSQAPIKKLKILSSKDLTDSFL